MSEFSITLPDNRKALVKTGKVTQKRLLRYLFQSRKSTTRTGYLVRTDMRDGAQKDYMLYKTNDGKWWLDAEGQRPPQENTIEMAIKKAIESHESSR